MKSEFAILETAVFSNFYRKERDIAEGAMAISCLMARVSRGMPQVTVSMWEAFGTAKDMGKELCAGETKTAMRAIGRMTTCLEQASLQRQIVAHTLGLGRMVFPTVEAQ